ILERQPPPATRVNPDLPLKLEEVISKTLEKDRNVRCQSAAELRADLKRLKRDTDSGRSSASDMAASRAALESPAAGASSTHAASSVHASGSSAVSAVAREHKFGTFAIVIIVLILVGAAAYGIYSFLNRAATVPFQNFSITQVTSTGEAQLAAISGDGKYILSVESADGKESLWLRNVPTNSNTQVIPPSFAHYQSLAFSPDGNYIYFRRAIDQSNTSYNLFRAPVLGGTPQQIASDVDTDITFSPDGKRIAYQRGNDPVIGQYRLLSANSDGSDEKTLLIDKDTSPGLFPAWSPDGKEIAYVLPGRRTIVLFDVASAKSTTLTQFKDRIIFEMHWLPDGRGLVMAYSGITTHFQQQIGYVSYPSGAFHAITRDTNNYSTLTLSSDGKTMATVQAKTTRTPYLLPAAGSQESSLPEAPLQIPDMFFLTWADNDDLLVSNETNLFRVARDGHNKTALLSDPAGVILAAAPCGNDHIVLSWLGHNSINGVIADMLWRANADGSNAQQMSDKVGLLQNMVCSPDGKTVYYFNTDGDRIMDIPAEGGKAEVVPGTLIPNEFVAFPIGGLSSDGKQLQFFTEGAPGHINLQIVDLNAGPNPPRRTLTPDPRVSGGVVFTPDGKAISYPITENGVANLWVQPLDGSKGRQITHFTSGTIAGGGWSPDGKTLALLRANTQSDIVLLRESAQ
ncbi:MAG: hypothetical protein WA876_16695, partial [Candidatus Acidiferrales bacterium]